MTPSEIRKNRIVSNANKLKGLEVSQNGETAKIIRVRATQGSFVLAIRLKFLNSRNNVLKALENKCKEVLDIEVTSFENIATESIKKQNEHTLATLEAKLFHIS